MVSKNGVVFEEEQQSSTQTTPLIGLPRWRHRLTTLPCATNLHLKTTIWSELGGSIGDLTTLERRREDGEDEDVEKEVSCTVCWDCINRRHEMRDLCNCSHVFHRDCSDRWVNEGRVTCPLCRSMLRPPNTNPWMVLRHAPHLSQQDQIPPIT